VEEGKGGAEGLNAGKPGETGLNTTTITKKLLCPECRCADAKLNADSHEWKRGAEPPRRDDQRPPPTAAGARESGPARGPGVGVPLIASCCEARPRGHGHAGGGGNGGGGGDDRFGGGAYPWAGQHHVSTAERSRATKLARARGHAPGAGAKINVAGGQYQGRPRSATEERGCCTLAWWYVRAHTALRASQHQSPASENQGWEMKFAVPAGVVRPQAK